MPEPKLATGRPPRTQQQRREETRRALLDAAVESLIQVGFARTTTLEVQRRAEVSRGALLHHFPSRAELLVAAVVELFNAQRDVVTPAVRRAQQIGSIDAGIDVLWQSFNSPLAVAIDELWSAA